MSYPKSDRVSVDLLEFDPLNPRLPLTMRGVGENELIKHFIIRENIFELMSSIAQQGYVSAEPILVVEREGGKYTVVEGNRRLASLKLLNNPQIASIKQASVLSIIDEAVSAIPQEVPVLIYEKREDILDYLGYRHVTGVGRWDSLAKARYLKELFDIHTLKSASQAGEVYKILAKTIGSRTDYIQKLLRGYFLYLKIQDEDYYSIPGLDDATFSFSLLTTAISYSNIADFVGINEIDSINWSYNADTLKELTVWMFKEGADGETRVPESRSLKTLNSVVANEKALSVFREPKPLEYASRFTDEPLELFNKAIEDARRLIEVADSQFFLITDIPSSTFDNVSHLSTKGLDLWLKVKGRKEG